MRLAKKWNRRIFAAVLGAVVVGAPLFAVHAEGGPSFSSEGERYDVRRGMYEKEGGSDEHIDLGKYADEEHKKARAEEQRQDREKRGETGSKESEKPQAEATKEETKREARKESGENNEKREYAYDVRRGMYEQEGGSDTEVRRGMYEQPSEDGERRGLVR